MSRNEKAKLMPGPSIESLYPSGSGIFFATRPCIACDPGFAVETEVPIYGSCECKSRVRAHGRAHQRTNPGTNAGKRRSIRPRHPRANRPTAGRTRPGVGYGAHG